MIDDKFEMQLGALLAISFLPTVGVYIGGSGSGDIDGDGSGGDAVEQKMSPVVVRISVVLLGVAVGCGAVRVTILEKPSFSTDS